MPTTVPAIAVALFGITNLAPCLWGMVAQKRLCQVVHSFWANPKALYLAVGLRLALGALLILAAPETQFPLAFQCLGGVAIAAALVIPIVGRKKIGQILAFFERSPAWVVRLWLCVGLAFAGFVLYGVL